MKMYRAGRLEYMLGGFSYCIQEKKWYGWKTLSTFCNKQHWQSAINDLKSKGYIVL